MIAGNSSKDIDGLPLYPIMKCSCGPEGATLNDNIEYVRSGRNLVPRKLRCPNCNSSNKSEITYRPVESFSRITNNKNLGVFAENNIPFQKGLFPSAIIQYSKKLNHFRMLKTFKDGAKIYDGATITFVADK
jgi:hypothetical protein